MFIIEWRRVEPSLTLVRVLSSTLGKEDGVLEDDLEPLNFLLGGWRKATRRGNTGYNARFQLLRMLFILLSVGNISVGFFNAGNVTESKLFKFGSGSTFDPTVISTPLRIRLRPGPI